MRSRIVVLKDQQDELVGLSTKILIRGRLYSSDSHVRRSGIDVEGMYT